MKMLTLTEAEADLLISTLTGIANDDSSTAYLANGVNSQWKRAVYLSDAHCDDLLAITRKIVPCL